MSAGFAVVSGLLPHVLHHAGVLAGAAIFAGAAGSVLFGVLGVLAAIPFLLRLHRRFGNWQAPGIALAAFAVIFAVSTFVIGPEINGGTGEEATSGSSPSGVEPAAANDPGSAAGGAKAEGGHAGHH
jgi:hypothetical protein